MSLINQEMAKRALVLCGITEKVSLKPMVCKDPDEKPLLHRCDSAMVWEGGERCGIVSKDLRVTEMKAGKQKILPFGGHCKMLDNVTGKHLPVDSPEEKDYTLYRFSQFGVG